MYLNTPEHVYKIELEFIHFWRPQFMLLMKSLLHESDIVDWSS
jgi:hypothetical protein